LNIGIPALHADTAVFRAFVKKMLPPGAIFELKIHQNAYTALQSSPRPLADFQGAASRQGRGGEKGEKGKKEEKGRG